MAKTANCRVCGKPFTCCNKTSAALGAFNYREVACSPECGKEYLRRVIEGRKASSEAPEGDTDVTATEVAEEIQAKKKRRTKAKEEAIETESE